MLKVPMVKMLVGAAAQLGGIVRMTISLTVILTEATSEVAFGFPIMIVLMVAKWVGDLVNEGLYDEHVDLAQVPLLAWSAPPATAHRRAPEIMSAPVVVLRPVEKLAVILKSLMTTDHNGFPVVTSYDPDKPRWVHIAIQKSQMKFIISLCPADIASFLSLYLLGEGCWLARLLQSATRVCRA
jgi:chloride channel 7